MKVKKISGFNPAPVPSPYDQTFKAIQVVKENLGEISTIIPKEYTLKIHDDIVLEITVNGYKTFIYYDMWILIDRCDNLYYCSATNFVNNFIAVSL